MVAEPDNLTKLLEKGRLLTLEKGEVFQSTDGNLQMSLVKEGYVKRYTIRNDGSLGVQSVYGPGHFFPLTLAYKLLFDMDIYTGPENIHYETITKAKIYTIDNLTFKEAVEKNPLLYKDLFWVSGIRQNSNIQRLENLSLMVYSNRVAHLLYYYGQTFGKPNGSHVIIQLPLTRQDIADILSCTRETASLCLSLLRKKKLIGNGKDKKIVIYDMTKLKKAAYS